jgi:RNA polymerase sigma factor (sigma-70 family)
MISAINPTNPDKAVKEYLPLVKGVAHHYKNHGLALDDLIQEGMLGLLQACQRFDSSHNVQFSTYASYWIKKYILLAVSKELKQTFNTTSLEADKIADSQSVVEQSVQETKDNSADILLQAEMPEIERQILLLSYNQGKAIKEIATLLNLSAEKVKQIRTKALRRLKKTTLKTYDNEGCGAREVR